MIDEKLGVDSRDEGKIPEMMGSLHYG